MLALGIDASCASCRTAGAAVARVCAELEVLPLDDYRMREWRHEALGPGAPHAPTLVAVLERSGAPDDVQAWCGARLVPALARPLGLRRAVAILGALHEAGVLGTVGKSLVRRPSPARGA